MSPFGPQVLELQDCVSRLQTLNNELQNRLSLVEKSDHHAYDKEDKDVASSSPWKKVRGHKLRHQSSFPKPYNKGLFSHLSANLCTVCPHFPNT